MISTSRMRIRAWMYYHRLCLVASDLFLICGMQVGEITHILHFYLY